MQAPEVATQADRPSSPITPTVEGEEERGTLDRIVEIIRQHGYVFANGKPSGFGTGHPDVIEIYELATARRTKENNRG